MKVERAIVYKIENLEEQTISALSSILCNIEIESINKYLESRGGIPSILSKKDVDNLILLGRAINHSFRDARK